MDRADREMVGQTTGLVPRRGSVRGLLLAPVLLVAMLLLGVEAGISVRRYRADLQHEYQDNLELARAVALTFDAFVQETRRDLLAAGESALTRPLPRQGRVSTLFQKEVAHHHPTLRSVTWISPAGRVLAASGREAAGADVSQERWFAQIARGSDWAITDIARGDDPDAGTFHISQAVRDERGALLGVVEAVVDGARLGERINLRRVQGGGYAIVDGRGWLAYQYPEKVTRREDRDWATVYPEVRRALGGSESTGLLRDRADGRRRIAASVPIRSLGWVATASRLETDVTGPIRREFQQEAGLLMAVAAFALLVAAVGARRITAPLERLGEQARKMAQGRRDHLAPVSGPAELGRLAQAFSRMSEEVAAREDEHQRLLEVERERARNARLLEAIQEHTMTMLAYLDRNLRFRYANSQYCRFLGHSCEALIGRTYQEVSDSEVARRWMQHVRDTGEAVHMRDVLRPATERPDIGPSYWDVSIVPVKDEHGEVEGVVVSVLDVTERVGAREERLEVERARAQLAETIAAEINHRMKNNLMLLSGVLQLQLSALPQDSDAAQELREAVARIASLSAVHEQLYNGRSGRVELRDALRRLGQIAARSLSRGEVEVAVEGDPIYVGPKAGSIVVMVANELLTNAVKHGAPASNGLVKVEVRLRREPGRIMLNVWNSGNPVPEDWDVGKTSGMGLRLAVGLAREQLGGSVTLRPQDGGTMAEVVIQGSIDENGSASSAVA